MYKVIALVLTCSMLHSSLGGPVTESINPLPISPCPEIVQYDYADGEGRLDATLVVSSPHILHGIWIRILFDRDIDEVTVKDSFGEVERRDGKVGFLIKNSDIILQRYEERLLRISVKYSGTEVPNLVEYRINAVTICPNSISNNGLYPNDKNASSDYLSSSITSEGQQAFSQENCGQTTSKDTYPWQASIFTKQNNTEHYTCDATLVSPKHLITAAHCITYLRTSYPISPRSLKIYFDQQDLNDIDTLYFAKKITLYPGYSSENFLNDIAIIELNAPKKGSFVCLAGESSAVEEQGLLSGFRIENDGFGKAGAAKIERIDDGKCLDGLFGEFKELLGDENYCASYLKDGDSCVGTSGSGHITENSGKWYLQGILNAGILLQGKSKCKDSDSLVLTNINLYSKWIRREISRDL